MCHDSQTIMLVKLLELPVNSWHDAIFLRHSQRKYSAKVPSDEVTARIETVCNEFKPFPGTRAVLVEQFL
ncbi:MAG: hypothetical protein ACTSQZ_01500 [Candidatus Thorarchaeota archaeon]